MIFGHQIEYAMKVFSAHREPLDFGSPRQDGTSRAELAKEYSRVVMQVLVSLIILGVSFYILLSHEFGDTLEKAAIGFVGTVVGYWLR
jgi:hypothetical protein